MDLVDIRFVRWKWMQRPSLAVPCQHGRAVHAVWWEREIVVVASCCGSPDQARKTQDPYVDPDDITGCCSLHCFAWLGPANSGAIGEIDKGSEGSRMPARRMLPSHCFCLVPPVPTPFGPPSSQTWTPCLPVTLYVHTTYDYLHNNDNNYYTIRYSNDSNTPER